MAWAKSQQNHSFKLRSMVSSARAVHTLGLTRQSYQGSHIGRSNALITLLNKFAYTEATLGVDKLFGLLGLASDATDSVFDPDYVSSMDTVVRRYANEFINRDHVIEMLQTAGISKGSTISSWIPAWMDSKTRSTISTWRGAKGVFCAGGTDVPWAMSASHQSKILQITGVVFDRITLISSASTEASDVFSVIAELRQVLKATPSYPTNEDLATIILRLPIGDAVHPYLDDVSDLDKIVTEREPERGHFDFGEDFENIDSVSDMATFLDKPPKDRERAWDYWKTAAEFMKRVGNGRFCMTAKGYAGIVPYQSQVGDEIFLMRGAAVPFVVRKTNQSLNHMARLRSLVGECYCHGIMYGEGLPQKRNLDECIQLV